MYQTPPTVVPNKLFMRNSEISELLQGYLGGGGGPGMAQGFRSTIRAELRTCFYGGPCVGLRA